MTLAKTGVQLLEERGLLGSDLDRRPGVSLLQSQPAPDLGSQIVLIEHLQDRDGRDPYAFKCQ